MRAARGALLRGKRLAPNAWTLILALACAGDRPALAERAPLASSQKSKPALRLMLEERQRFAGGGRALAFSHKGDRFVAGSGGSMFRIFKGGKIEHEVKLFDFGRHPFFRRDDRLLYFPPYTYYLGQKKLVTRQSKKKRGLGRGRCGGSFSITASTFTPDGKDLVAFFRYWPPRCATRGTRSSSGQRPKDRLVILDATTGQERALLSDGYHYQVPIAASAALIAAGGSKIGIWERESRAKKTELRPPVAMAELRFSPDGSLLAGAANDGSVCLWQVRDWRRRRCWKAHREHAGALAFHPRLPVLASGGWDKKLALWRTDGIGRPKLLRKKRLAGQVEGLSFDVAGGRLLAFVSGSAKNQLILFRVRRRGKR